MMMYKKITVALILPMFAFNALTHAQTSGAATTAKGADSTAKKSVVKPYKEVITGKAVSKFGMLAVHKVDEKYYFEIADSQLKREILITTRLVQAPAGSFAKLPGEVVNTKTIAFEKGTSNNIYLRVLTFVNEADSNSNIAIAVKNASIDPIVNVFDIKALGNNGKSYVIDVTDLLKNENVITGFSTATKKTLRLGGVAADRSYLSSINMYPQNMEIRSVRTYTGGGAGEAPAAGADGATAPDAGDAGAFTFGISTSMMLLPEVPMQRRLDDPRIGYFTHKLSLYSDKQQQVEEVSFINRVRLEPRDEDIEKYKRGELVEPKKQIVFYTDPATPKQWRPFIIAGINQWQKAFEAAGFKNAIVGKEWPEGDSTMSLEDARYFVVRYLPGQTPNAYGARITDPRSGEILQAYIGWYHNIMRILHDFYFMQAGAQDPAGRSMQLPDTLMGKLISMAITHEVGHSLGLLHNMGGSSHTPVEMLRNKAWLDAHGYTASIMDYARFNYVAQPEDNVGANNLLPRMGEYDAWAIKWGYTWLGKMDPKAEQKITRKWLTDSLAKNPRLWYGGEGKDNDPRAQTEDLGDNSIKATEYGLKNLKRVVTQIDKWTFEPYDTYDNLITMYDKVGAELNKYFDHLLTNIGGVYEDLQTGGESATVYRPVPKARQREAVALINKEFFHTQNWALDKELLNKFRKPGRTEFMMKIQENEVTSLLSTSLLNRIMLQEKRFGSVNGYTLDEYLTDLEKGIFEELYSNKPIDTYRRGVQKAYVNFINQIIKLQSRTMDKATDIPDFGSTDMVATLMAHLSKIQAAAKKTAMATTDKTSKYHLQYMSDLITYIMSKS